MLGVGDGGDRPRLCSFFAAGLVRIEFVAPAGDLCNTGLLLASFRASQTTPSKPSAFMTSAPSGF